MDFIAYIGLDLTWSSYSVLKDFLFLFKGGLVIHSQISS